MIVKSVVDTTVIDEILKRFQKERTGIHLSDLDLCLKKAYYRRLHPQPITPKQGIMYAIGYGVQEYLWPGEEVPLVVDGINCSPDSYKGNEVKTTRASMKNFDPLKPHWLLRIKGYCKALGITKYLLSVIFLLPSELLTWEFHFTPEEIEENWKEVLMRRDILKLALETNSPPIPDFHQDWECKKYCECTGFCLNNITQGRKEVRR